MTGREEVSERKFEEIIGSVLRIGVVTAATIVFIGGILYLISNGATIPNYHTFSQTYSNNLNSIFANVAALKSYGIIQLGLLLLIATPIMRVMFSVVVFALQRDSAYVIFTLIVLAVLLYSIIGRGTG